MEKDKKKLKREREVDGMILTDLVGLKIVSVRGFRMDMRRKKHFIPEYILFDDHKTFIALEEQDYHTYHDCDTSAMRISIRQDSLRWNAIHTDEKQYPVADIGIGWGG